LSAGSYRVDITDSTAPTPLTAARIFTLTQPPAIVVSGSQTNVTANGAADGSATATPQGGVAGYTYAWAPSGGTGATATGLTAGTYTVTVTDANNCAAAHSFTITEPAAVPPVAQADSYSTPVNTALLVPAPGVLVNDSSPSGLPLGVVLAAGPAHGSITLYGDGAFTYTPNANYAGTDSFSYVASAGAASAAPAMVNITVSAATPASTTSIPTLSEWGLIGLSSLVGLFALGRVRRRAE